MVKNLLRVLAGSPPLARGVLHKDTTLISIGRITPACAGSTKITPISVAMVKDHPRLRGEYVWSSWIHRRASGSPPLARGVLTERRNEMANERITPACAGSTKKTHHFPHSSKDHPRLRGEYTKKSLILRDPCLLV